MSANEQQVGGDHYKAMYQHWDFCIDLNIGYLESAATKYVSRWQKKNGVQDLEKSIHYISKASEAFRQGRYKNNSLFRQIDVRSIDQAISKTTLFFCENQIEGPEAHIIQLCAMWCCDEDLSLAIAKIRDLIAEAKEAAGAPVAAPGATLPGGGISGHSGRTYSRAQRPVGQGAGASTSTGVAEKQSIGLEHPFGYDEADD